MKPNYFNKRNPYNEVVIYLETLPDGVKYTNGYIKVAGKRMVSLLKIDRELFDLEVNSDEIITFNNGTFRFMTLAFIDINNYIFLDIHLSDNIPTILDYEKRDGLTKDIPRIQQVVLGSIDGIEAKINNASILTEVWGNPNDEQCQYKTRKVGVFDIEDRMSNMDNVFIAMNEAIVGKRD